MKGSVIYGVVNVIWHTETDSLSARAKNTINAVVDHHLQHKLLFVWTPPDEDDFDKTLSQKLILFRFHAF